MFKSLDSIASVVGIFMYLTISKFKQVLRSRKGLDYNTDENKVIQCYLLEKTFNTFWMNKEKFTRTGFEPATSGLTCRCSAN